MCMLWKDFEQLHIIRKPMAKFERMNKTIIQMLKTLSEKEKTSWKDHINKLTYAYNCTQHSSTGYAPEKPGNRVYRLT